MNETPRNLGIFRMQDNAFAAGAPKLCFSITSCLRWRGWCPNLAAAVRARLSSPRPANTYGRLLP